MKNILIVTFAGLLTGITICYGQNKVEVGIRFIPQVTTFRYTQGVGPIVDFLKVSAPYYHRTRTAQGIGITYHPSQRVGIGADILYSLQGGGYEQRKTNLNYMKLPLWVGYNSTSKRKIIFIVQSGIELSYLVSAKLKYPEGKPLDIHSYVNRTSWGIPFAIGAKFKVYQSYFLSIQLYVYSDISSLAKTNTVFGVYNYIYPGLRISIDRNLRTLKSH